MPSTQWLLGLNRVFYVRCVLSCAYDYLMIDERAKYCGDWTDKIKLLRSITSNITINIFSDGSHSQRGFRAELRLVNRPQESEAVRCDNQRFRYLSGKCYLVSTYPEVSWSTAHRICSDIQSELININSITEENAFASLLLGENKQRLIYSLESRHKLFGINCRINSFKSHSKAIADKR